MTFASDLWGQLVRYGITGGFVTALGAGVYWVTATFAGIPPLAANVLAYAVAVATCLTLFKLTSVQG